MFTGGENEVWSFGDENYPILKKYMEFRELMRPYTRQLMGEAHEKGTPVMRTLFYEFPEDAKDWGVKDEYLFGPDVLVAPVMEAGAVERDVYLPEGASWTNLHTGEVHRGGVSLRAAAPIGTIPLFLKEGSHQEWIGQLS